MNVQLRKLARERASKCARWAHKARRAELIGSPAQVATCRKWENRYRSAAVRVLDFAARRGITLVLPWELNEAIQ